MAREIGEGLEWDPAEAKKWDKEDYEANALYLLDRSGDVAGTANNELLVEIVTNRVGEDKVEDELTNMYITRFAEVEAPEEVEADGVPADEMEPGSAGKAGKK